jgi:hypothetical protein
MKQAQAVWVLARQHRDQGGDADRAADLPGHVQNRAAGRRAVSGQRRRGGEQRRLSEAGADPAEDQPR